MLIARKVRRSRGLRVSGSRSAGVDGSVTASGVQKSVKPASEVSPAVAGSEVQLERGLVGQGRFSGYMLRGLWYKEPRYVDLRNAAWLLRNTRVGQVYNPAALALVLHEAKALLREGEDLYDVLEAFAELLIHP